MKKFFIFILLTAFSFYGCSNVTSQIEKKENIKVCKDFRLIANVVDVKEIPPSPYCDKFIFVKAKNEPEGLKFEYDWLRQNYPGYKRLRQDLASCDLFLIDILTIETKENEVKQICFEISSFFGKWY